MENYSDVFPLSQTNIIKSLAQHFPFQSRVQAPSPCHEFGQADSAWTPFCPRPPLSRLYGNRGPLPADRVCMVPSSLYTTGAAGEGKGNETERRATILQEGSHEAGKGSIRPQIWGWRRPVGKLCAVQQRQSEGLLFCSMGSRLETRWKVTCPSIS